MMRSNGDDETIHPLEERNLQLERRIENLEQQRAAVANEPDKSKYLANRPRFYAITACVAVAFFVVVVTTLGVMLNNKSSSSDATTSTEQESEAPLLPGPTTMAPTFGGVLLDPTATPSTAPPTLNPSTTPPEQPVDPSCQVVYPSIPNLSCISREESWGEDAIAYGFSVDCGAYGDYEAQTGLWESGRTIGGIFDSDWVRVDDLVLRSNANDCNLSFVIPTAFTPSCIRIRLDDDPCTASYSSDCVDLNTCWWD
jgi:hypothetical protein